MPWYVLGGIPADLPVPVRARVALLPQVTLLGGPFATRAAAEAFRQGYLPAQHQHSETMLGLALPRAHYTVSAGTDLIAALCVALDLPDPGER